MSVTVETMPCCHAMAVNCLHYKLQELTGSKLLELADICIPRGIGNTQTTLWADKLKAG